MKKLLLCFGLAVTLSACGSDHIIRLNLDPQQYIETEPAYEARSHFFLWGMFQKTDHNLMYVCRSKGIKAIETHWTFYDSLMNGLTMGVYAPESISVYCN